MYGLVAFEFVGLACWILVWVLGGCLYLGGLRLLCSVAGCLGFRAVL